MTLCDIVAAYNQVVAGTQRLIELAVGRPVEMRYGIRYQHSVHFEYSFGGVGLPGGITRDGAGEMTENYATPHLELDGEPIEDLKQFEEPITRGIVPTRLSGHDAQTDNIFRAYQGYAAIRAHAPLMHGGPGGFDCGCDLSDRIKDLLSDLHHLCDTAGVDWMLAVGSSAA